jgi:uncharacterized protein (DUF1499 family)
MTNEEDLGGLETLPPERADQPLSRLAVAALGIAVGAALMATLGALGTRSGLWEFGVGFELVRWGVYAGLLAVIAAGVAIFRARPGGPRRGFIYGFLALLLGLLTIVIPLQSRRVVNSPAAVDDITTDTENPPPFAQLAPDSSGSMNAIGYAGADGPDQRELYPDIRPLVIDLNPQRAFQRALDVAQGQGWEIVSSSPADGRIEAADRSFWFGFTDDIVVRLTPLSGRTVVDLRVRSRDGPGDQRTNARRIREYLDAIQP